MRNPAAQGRCDANQSDVVQWYTELFCSVLDTHTLGFGTPDLLIGCAGQNEWVEIKTENGKLLPTQLRFARDWRGSKVTIVRDQQDVVEHVSRIRLRQSQRPPETREGR